MIMNMLIALVIDFVLITVIIFVHNHTVKIIAILISRMLIIARGLAAIITTILSLL